jgi:LEA14-like dessication related protein
MAIFSNFVDSLRITSGLSTGRVLFEKLSMSGMRFSWGLQTVFDRAQVVDIKVENRLVHTNWPCLSTTAIDL